MIRVVLLLTVLPATALAYHQSSTCRRGWLRQAFAKAAGLSSLPVLLIPSPSYASEQPLISSIEEAQTTLKTLLDNWDRATIECNYADISRDLLKAERKQELLEKASTFALFDKSDAAVVESCKTTNRLVRDYLGVTGKGPMVGLDKKLRKALELVDDPDQLDSYVTELESLSQSLAKASSLSYMAGTADFDSINNFDKADFERDSNSNLEQSRRAIQDVNISLERMLAILAPSA